MATILAEMEVQPKLTSLAAALRKNRETLLARWLNTLRIGMERPGAVLTDIQLRDHISDLLEDLCNQLEVPLTDASEISALQHAEVHGDARWMQGYKLPELLREIASLRTVVIAAVVGHGFHRLDLQEQSLANIIVHRFFDALIVESATFFSAMVNDAALLKERHNLAQELHDSACQTIQSALLHLALIRNQLDEQLRAELDIALSAFNQGLDDIRIIARGLVSAARKLEEGLPAALEEFAKEINRSIACQVCCDPNISVPPPVGFQLFRIVQEATGNASKHGHAEHIEITLRATENALELEVRDDGQGFDVTHPAGGGGIGLYNMRQRARALGGCINIQSTPGVGTTVACIVPNSEVREGVRQAVAAPPMRASG